MVPLRKIYLIRHGETEWNRAGRFQGVLDSPLTSLGLMQARQLGERLAKCADRIDVVYVSPLNRAWQTYDVVSRYIGPTTVQIDDRLSEVSTGSWDGLTQVDIGAGWPGVLDGSSPFDWYFCSPDGEDYLRAAERVGSFLSEIQGTVLVVSHGLLGRILRGTYLGLSHSETLTLPVPQDVIWEMSGKRITRLE